LRCEAIFFVKKTILLHEKAINSFPSLTATKKAVFLNLENVEFFNKLHLIIEFDSSVIIDKSLKATINTYFLIIKL